jgi:hypothetical protein
MIKFKPAYIPPNPEDRPPDLSTTKKKGKTPKLATSTSGLLLLPDQIIRPGYTSPKLGTGLWATCRRDVISSLTKPG